MGFAPSEFVLVRKPASFQSCLPFFLFPGVLLAISPRCRAKGSERLMRDLPCRNAEVALGLTARWHSSHCSFAKLLQVRRRRRHCCFVSSTRARGMSPPCRLHKSDHGRRLRHYPFAVLHGPGIDTAFLQYRRLAKQTFSDRLCRCTGSPALVLQPSGTRSCRLLRFPVGCASGRIAAPVRSCSCVACGDLAALASRSRPSRSDSRDLAHVERVAGNGCHTASSARTSLGVPALQGLSAVHLAPDFAGAPFTCFSRRWPSPLAQIRFVSPGHLKVSIDGRRGCLPTRRSASLPGLPTALRSDLSGCFHSLLSFLPLCNCQCFDGCRVPGMCCVAATPRDVVA